MTNGADLFFGQNLFSGRTLHGDSCQIEIWCSGWIKNHWGSKVSWCLLWFCSEKQDIANCMELCVGFYLPNCKPVSFQPRRIIFVRRQIWPALYHTLAPLPNSKHIIFCATTGTCMQYYMLILSLHQAGLFAKSLPPKDPKEWICGRNWSFGSHLRLWPCIFEHIHQFSCILADWQDLCRTFGHAGVEKKVPDLTGTFTVLLKPSNHKDFQARREICRFCITSRLRQTVSKVRLV